MTETQKTAIPCYVFDFSLSAAHCGSRVPIIDWCKENASKWVFQEEMSEAKEEKKTGYHHWQGRVCLIKKKRLNTLIKSCAESVMKKCHWSVTSTNAKGGFQYVMKADTRINGPWSDKDTETEEVLAEIKEDAPKWYPWQEEIINDCKDFKEGKRRPDKRKITLIFDEKGEAGKSTLVRYLTVTELAMRIPPVTDAKDMIQIAMCMKKTRSYIIDIPRSDRQKPWKVAAMWSGIETLKDGYSYDIRHSFKFRQAKLPAIFVFTNTFPDLTCLSKDRWNIVFIDYKHELVPYEQKVWERCMGLKTKILALEPKPVAPPRKRHEVEDMTDEEIISRVKRLKTLSM